MNEIVKQKLEYLKTHLPYGAKIANKSGWFWTALAWIVKVITFGYNKTFGTWYLTTLGRTIYIPDTLMLEFANDPIQYYQLLNHELTHIARTYKLGFGNFYLGAIIYNIAWLLLPIPIGFAFCRYAIEREGYVAGFKAIQPFLNNGEVNSAIINKEVDWIVSQLCTGAYGWSNIFKSWVEKDILKRLNT